MADYYVATDGDDGGAGTISDPWETWHYGFNQISPDDILWIRGGTYTPSTYHTTSSRNCAVYVDGKDGSSGSPYQVFAYPGETPILDCRNVTGSNERIGILILDSSYWHLKGLHITRVDQPSAGGVGGQGIFIWGINSAAHNTIENCKAYVCGGPGMGTRDDVNETLFLNCDFYDNWDAYSGWPGGNADGVDVGYSNGIIRFVGCRAWHNGDDGFDLYCPDGWDSTVYLTNCWALHHGYSPTEGEGGDGSGFKLGTGNGLQSDSTVRRYLYNCIAVDNANNGFDQNSGNMKTVAYNCIAYENGNRGYDFHWNNQYDVFANCISYDNGSSDSFLSNVTEITNSWQNGISVSGADFITLVTSQLTGSRQSNGDLPVMTSFHLAEGSDMIGAGTDMGQSYDGDGNVWDDPISIGAFAFGGTPPEEILVESIEVYGEGDATTITVDNGSLQMHVNVLPVDADDKTVTWSRINGTGSASISGTGLLTAITNGIVTVRATANDSSGVYGELEITISNQTNPTQVPDTDYFTLQDVVDVVQPVGGDTLVDCFNEANEAYFDSTYSDSVNSLLTFRNYTISS